MTVLITGASAGIGRALAEELSAAGAKLALAARRMDRLEKLNECLGGRHLCIRADVSRIDDCRQMIDQAIERFGRIDTLVCNAGYGMYRRVAETTPQEVREIFQTNVFGTTDCIYFAVPLMQKQELRDGFRGQIMLVSSVVARRGVVFIGMYSATKAAQLALGEAMRVELEPSRIAVTTVHPVTTQTEFGDVARTIGKMQVRHTSIVQTAEHVAHKMVGAIVKPRPEVWPNRGAGWGVGLGTLMPRLSDFAIARYRDRIERANSINKPSHD
jgi:short-subunit dehydrogenase